MLKPGMFISDRYEIIDNVGSGGMADVYKAKDQRLNRFVAIKVLKPEYSSDKSFVNKFRGEAQSAAGLSHPNIVNVYDVGDDSGLHYIVMELVEGITLKRFIERKGKLEVKEAVGIAIQIAQGMEAAHDNHIIHRDIKPQNIIISRDGKVKVTDFGIAKATNSNTITSNAMGSVHYLSPEQARGGYSDEKSDIYSLGVTLYEMLSGKVPFAGDNTVSVALLHIQGEAMPLRDLDQSIPVSVDKIVQKCMQKRPERRYHSASELILDLKRAIANPDGDFVQIPAFVTSDSPTINISDDLGKIKNGAYLEEDLPEKKNNNGHYVTAEEEDDDLDSMDSKLTKFSAVGTIVLIIIFAIAIISLVVWLIFPKEDKKEPVKKPPVTEAPTNAPTLSPTPELGSSVGTYKFPLVIGYTKEDAEEIIKAKDPKAFITWKEDSSNEYAKGYVIFQYPAADRDAAYGSDDIIITISTGPQPFVIPNVYNLTEAQAEKKLKECDLKTITDYVYSDYEAGKVIETNPPKDTLVVAGDTVTIMVSLGQEQTIIPKLIGMTAEQAKKALTDAGLAMGTISYEASAQYPEGQITFQSETANSKTTRGTLVDVIVSTGPASTGPGNNGSNNDSNNNDPDDDNDVVDGGNDIDDDDDDVDADQDNDHDGVIYTGRVIINESPFQYGYGDGEADIYLEMVQEGYDPEPIYDGYLSVNDFPLLVTDIIGNDKSPGKITMYVDNQPFIMPGETSPHTWTVYFVED